VNWLPLSDSVYDMTAAASAGLITPILFRAIIGTFSLIPHLHSSYMCGLQLVVVHFDSEACETASIFARNTILRAITSPNVRSFEVTSLTLGLL
jgi:hypothetical protein